MSDVTRTKWQACPYCGWVVDAIGTPDGRPRRPKRGDITLCLKCSGICLFERNLRIAKLTQDQWNALPEDEQLELRKLQKVVQIASRESWRETRH